MIDYVRVIPNLQIEANHEKIINIENVSRVVLQNE